MQTSLDKVRQLPTKKPRRISPSDEYSGLISFRMDLQGLHSLQSKGLSIDFSNTTVQKHLLD